MKWITATILSGIFIALFCGADVLLSLVTDRDWASTTLWFVVPVGGFIVGMAGGVGMGVVERFSDTDGGSAAMWFGVLGGLICWIAVNVSLYEVDTSGLASFTDWLIAKAGAPVSFHVEFDHRSGDSPPLEVPLVGLISMIVQPFGAMFGGMAGAALFSDGKPEPKPAESPVSD